MKLEEYKKINENHRKYAILCEKDNFILVKDNDCKDFYFFGTIRSFEALSFPVNQCGTLEEIKNELSRWKHEIDFDNPKMAEIENAFLAALSEF